VGEATNGDEAVSVARRTMPDVVLLDVQMPRSDGLAALAGLNEHCPCAKVVILTMFDLDEYVVEALSRGVSGFLLKTAPPDELLDAIHTVHAGRQFFADTVMNRLVDTFVARG